jgi:hypothetical protein
MKNMKFLIKFLPMLLLLPACENDIKLFNKDQEKTYVVFGLINSTDPLQQVKVRMTSITDSAIFDISKDSSEFSATPNLLVSIQEWYQNNYATYEMKPVLYPKEPGIFFNTRNDLYEAVIKPSTDMVYKLIITNPDNGDLVEAKILPVPAPKLGAPTWSWIRYNFSNLADPFNIRFNIVPRVKVYLICFTINYIEVSTGGDTLMKNKSWVFQPRYVDNPPDYIPSRENLGSELNQHVTKGFTYRIFDLLIPDQQDLYFRQLICFDVSVWGGDENLRNYTELGIKFNDDRKQSFSNINNGIGFFAGCSHTGCTGVLPDQDFMDSLPLNPITARLKFRPDLYRTNPAQAVPEADRFLSLMREISHE